MSKSHKAALPKARLISVSWWGVSMWTRFRLANAVQIHIGRLVVVVRAPWLETSARAIYPHLFQTPPKQEA